MEEQIRSLALRQQAVTQRYLCPACSADRRHNTDRCLSVTVGEGRAVWLCQHCSFRGAMPLESPREAKGWASVASPPPPYQPPQETPEKAIAWLRQRGVSVPPVSTEIVQASVFFRGEGNHQAIGFTYPDATKWRALDGKMFTQTGAARTLWRLEKIAIGSPLVITEGEIDALSLVTAGVEAVSVPNGAPEKVSNGMPSPREDKKFSYIWAAKEHIDAAPKIVLALDTDGPGDALGEELARRIGRAKCWRVQWPSDCKDANDVLVRHGKDILKGCIDGAKPWPVKGLYDAAQFFDGVDTLYVQGMPSGESTGFANIDTLYTVVPGQLTVVTGSPGSGKSAFIDNVMVNLARNKGWKFGVCSFENPPAIHIANLLSIATGRPFFDGPTPRMSQQMVDQGKQWLRDHFFFLHQQDGSLSSLDDIVDLAKTAVLRYGIRGLILDPYNHIGRSGDKNETDWVNEALTKIKVLAKAHDLHIWFVAHPTKLRRKEDGTYPVPTGYDIAGSGHFYNHADAGVTVHRPDRMINKTEIHTWKIRYRFTGSEGKDDLTYDRATGVYWSPVR